MKQLLTNLVFAAVFSVFMLKNATCQISYPVFSSLNYDVNTKTLVFGNLPYSYYPLTNYSVLTAPGVKNCKASIKHSKYGYLNGIMKDARRTQRPKFRFKANDDNSAKFSSIIITPENTDSYTIGKDSFVVVKDFYKQTVSGAHFCKKPQFVQYLGQFGDYHFYLYSLRLNSNGTFLYRKVGSSEFNSFSFDKSKFNNELKSLFGEFSVTRNSIENQKYSIFDLPNLIHYLVYKKAYESGENVCVDEDLQYVNMNSSKGLLAKVDSVNSNTFYISYYSYNNVKLGCGPISSFVDKSTSKNFVNFYNIFCPVMVLNGSFKWYYPNGNILKSIDYEFGDPISISDFYPNGRLLSNVSKSGKDKTNFQVYSTEGNPVLNAAGDGILIFRDSIHKGNPVLSYKNGVPEYACYNDSIGNRVYLSTQSNARLLYFDRKFSDFIKNKPHIKDVIQHAGNGTFFAKLRMDADGAIISIEPFHGISTEIDSVLIEFLNAHKNPNSWVHGKVNGRGVMHEFVWSIAIRAMNLKQSELYYYQKSETLIWRAQ